MNEETRLPMLQVQELPGRLRVLWLMEDGEELWYEYQAECLCEECAW